MKLTSLNSKKLRHFSEFVVHIKSALNSLLQGEYLQVNVLCNTPFAKTHVKSRDICVYVYQLLILPVKSASFL